MGRSRDKKNNRDVLQLLRKMVAEAGGHVSRSILNKVLRGRIPPTKSVIRALKLRVVYLQKKNLCGSNLKWVAAAPISPRPHGSSRTAPSPAAID
jgi:hypothetical protein